MISVVGGRSIQVRFVSLAGDEKSAGADDLSFRT